MLHTSLALLGINLDHGTGGVDGRDVRLLRPVAELELRLEGCGVREARGRRLGVLTLRIFKSSHVSAPA